MTITQLLDEMIEALGGRDALEQWRGIEFEATVTFGTLTGVQHSVVDYESTRFVHSTDFRSLASANGFDGVTLWNVDYNGRLCLLNDRDRIDQVVAEERLLRGDFLLHPENYRFELVDGGSGSELALEVVRREHESSPFGRAIVGVDRTTSLITSYDRIHLGARLLTRFFDYQRFGDILFPTRIEDSGGDERAETMTIESLIINPEFDPAIFSAINVDTHDYQFLTGELRSVVPLIHELDHIYTEVVIDGRSYRFMVDTGADSTVISTEIMETLRLPSLGTVEVNGVNGVQEVDYVQLGELWVGNVLLMKQQVMALDFTALRRRVPELDGILGLDFFKRFVVGLDYVRGEMEIIDRSAFSYKGGGGEISLDHNLVEMGFDGFHGKFRVDTGGSCLSIHAPFVREHDLLRNRNMLPCTSTIAGVGGTELTICAARCHTLSVAGYTLRDAQIRLMEISTGAFSQQRSIGNVGSDVWSRFLTWFDFTGGRMYLEPNTNFDEMPPYSRLGLVLKAENDGYFVDSFLTNSPAAELGVERGDELLEFDNVPATSIPFGPLRARFRDPAGTPLAMTFRRSDGSINRTVVVLKDFLGHYDCGCVDTDGVGERTR